MEFIQKKREPINMDELDDETRELYQDFDIDLSLGDKFKPDVDNVTELPDGVLTC